MRVLLALDGSPSSDAACELVRSLAWVGGSAIDVIGVLEPVADVLTPLVVSAPALQPFERQTSHDLKRTLDHAVASLEKPTLAVRRRILVGRPGTRIVDAATDTRAELIVVGSRGRGPLTSMLLGSVSAEVVDHAPCPVLVVRGPIAGPILVAVDGSPSAQAAVTYLSANRIFAPHAVEVLCVAPGNDLPGVYSAIGISDLAVDSFERRLGESRERAEPVAAAAARSLGASGHRARWSVITGNAAHEIIEAAKAFGSGLIVMGSRGHTGLARIVLGSVARNVLLHSSASVLIVREPIRAPSAEQVGRVDGRPVAQTTTARPG